MYEVYLVGHALSRCIGIHGNNILQSCVSYYCITSKFILAITTRITAKDVTNFNNKLCTTFLLESILYILNFSLMENILLYLMWF